MLRPFELGILIGHPHMYNVAIQSMELPCFWTEIWQLLSNREQYESE